LYIVGWLVISIVRETFVPHTARIVENVRNEIVVHE